MMIGRRRVSATGKSKNDIGVPGLSLRDDRRLVLEG